MVLQTERYNGGYQQQSFSGYHGSNGGYNRYQSLSDYSTPYPGSFQVTTYPLNHGSQNQYSGWSSGDDCYGNGGHPVKPTIGGYESSYNYENSYTHGNTNHHGTSLLHQTHGSQLHGSDHQSHGSPHGQGYGYGGSHHQGHGVRHGQDYEGDHEFGKTHGVGGAITHKIKKMTHAGYNNYGNRSPNYGHNPSGFSHGYQKPSWTVKGLNGPDDDDE